MTNIVQGKYYNIALITPYTDKGPLFVQVTAITKLASIELFGTNDIREKFFSDVGILTYLSMVQEDTDIYVTIPIKGTDPVETDAGNPIFIPVTIIDHNNTDEWKFESRFSFSIEGVTRHFENSLDEREFSRNIATIITNALNNTVELAADSLSLSTSFDEFLASSKVINNETSRRDEIIKEKLTWEIARNKEDLDKKELALKEKTYIDDKKEEYEKAISGVKDKEEEATQLTEITNNFVQKQNQIISYFSSIMDYIAYICVLNDLFSNVVDNPLPNFETIFNAFVEKRNGGVNLPNYISVIGALGYGTIKYKGFFKDPPNDPSVGWFYYNTTQQKTMIFNSAKTWEEFAPVPNNP